MGVYLYQDANFSKQLKTLQKGGGNSAMAAAHALSIIKQLIEGGCRSPREMGRLTKHGEARIKNSFKFDLVGGYRLIGVMRGKEITFLFVGSHDECDHWIKNNAGREPVSDRRRNLVIEIRENERMASRDVPSEEDDPESDYDEHITRSLTDRQLRKIFCGISGG
ncbi:MAG: hypothetical protein ABFD97_19005 [Syntrophobacter sp.]